MSLDKQAMIEASQKQLAHKKAQMDIETRITLAMPDDLPIAPRQIHAHLPRYHCDGLITFEIGGMYRAEPGDWRDFVPELIRLLPPEEVIRYQDSCTSYLPEGGLDTKETAYAEDHPNSIELLFPVVVTRDGIDRQIIEWWTLLDGLMVNVQVRTGADGLMLVDYYVTRDKGIDGRALSTFDYSASTQFPREVSTKWYRSSRSEYGRLTVAWRRRHCDDGADVARQFVELAAIKGGEV